LELLLLLESLVAKTPVETVLKQFEFCLPLT
jgi:hypothetical protein